MYLAGIWTHWGNQTREKKSVVHCQWCSHPFVKEGGIESFKDQRGSEERNPEYMFRIGSFFCWCFMSDYFEKLYAFSVCRSLKLSFSGCSNFNFIFWMLHFQFHDIVYQFQFHDIKLWLYKDTSVTIMFTSLRQSKTLKHRILQTF